MNNDYVAMTGHVKNGNYDFVFLNDNTACEIDENGYIKRVGIHKVSYSQNEIINKIFSSFNTNNLEKGECFEFDNFYKIIFDYKSLVAQNKIIENVISIKIPKNILEDDNCYTNFHRLVTICNQLNKIKLINQEKINALKKKTKIEKKNNFILGLIMAGSMLASSFFVMYGITEAAKEESERQQKIIDDINKERKEHDLPPLGFLDETGKQYESWNDYYNDIKKKQQNDSSSDEEIEPLFEEAGPVL